MRILQLSSARQFGGGERHLVDLTNGLIRRGHQIFVAVPPDSPVLPELQNFRAENIVRLPFRKPIDLGTAWRLRRFVRAHNVEIVHAHVARDYPLAALATGRLGAELVLTRHVLFPLNPIHNMTLRRTARVIAVSQAVADALYSQRIFHRDKIALIHNGIDLNKFEPASKTRTARQPGDIFLVGMVAHLGPIKGPEDFVRAAAILCARRPGVEFRIAGEDKSPAGENRKNLEKLISDTAVSDRVKLLGWVTDVAKLFSTLDLFVSPSRSEPFGLSIVEAMAAGVAVVATATEGASEIIQDGETGRLVPIGDVQALANTIEELLADAVERERLARNARAAAIKNFSIDRMIAETEGVYRDVLGG